MISMPNAARRCHAEDATTTEISCPYFDPAWLAEHPDFPFDDRVEV